MAIAEQLSRLNELRQNLAAVLTAKGVTAAETEGLETLVPKVGTIETSEQGIILDTETTATADTILEGYTAYDNNGVLMTGSLKGCYYKAIDVVIDQSADFTFPGANIIAACFGNRGYLFGSAITPYLDSPITNSSGDKVGSMRIIVGDWATPELYTCVSMGGSIKMEGILHIFYTS